MKKNLSWLVWGPWVSLSLLGMLSVSSCSKLGLKGNASYEKKDLKQKEGWLGPDTYLSFGEANSDQVSIMKKGEAKEDSCKRKASFDAKEKIIPSFMKSPKAKPPSELQRKMASILNIIETGQILEFNFNPEDESCRCLFQIKKEGLRSMVEEIN
jgi:hypothetical protein